MRVIKPIDKRPQRFVAPPVEPQRVRELHAGLLIARVQRESRTQMTHGGRRPVAIDAEARGREIEARGDAVCRRP